MVKLKKIIVESIPGGDHNTDCYRDKTENNPKRDRSTNLPFRHQRYNQEARIPAGTFTMGDNEELMPGDGEAPERQVTISSDFFIGKSTNPGPIVLTDLYSR